jgi:hypothetical protein
MKKLILPLLLLILSFECTAQSADFLILKRKGKNTARYFAGSNIQFMTTSGAYIDGLINEIKHDSIFLQQFIVQQLPTTFGTFITDTVGSYHYKFDYRQIAAINATKRQNFDWRGSGAALLGGGTLLVLGSGIVYLADRQKFSAPLMIAGAALGTLSYFMAKGGSSGIVIGKKYQLQYISMQNQK